MANGILARTIFRSSQDTDKANFFEYMRKQYDNIFKVASVARYEDVLPHFEVGGK